MPADPSSSIPSALAQLAHADAAELLVTSKQVHYLLVVKANQPSLLDRCAGLPWHDVPSWTAPATRCTAGSSSAPLKVAAALRQHARDPTRPWPPSGSLG